MYISYSVANTVAIPVLAADCFCHRTSKSTWNLRSIIVAIKAQAGRHSKRYFYEIGAFFLCFNCLPLTLLELSISTLVTEQDVRLYVVTCGVRLANILDKSVGTCFRCFVSMKCCQWPQLWGEMRSPNWSQKCVDPVNFIELTAELSSCDINKGMRAAGRCFARR